MNKLLLFFLFMIFTSCSSKVAMILYGIDATPNPKSISEIKLYSKKRKYPTDNQYLVNATGFRTIAQMDKMVTRYLLFDKHGNQLIDTFKNTCTGNSNLALANVIKNKLYVVDSIHNLETITKNIIDYNGNKAAFRMNYKTDFVLVLTWATWAGRLNEDGYLNWHKQATLIRNDYDIEILNLNVDLLKIEDYKAGN